MRGEVLRLYRCCLRVAYRFPLAEGISGKLRFPCEITLLCACYDGCYKSIKSEDHFLTHRYNIREVFEVYRNETNPDRIKQLLSDGWENVETLKKLSKWTPETWTFGMTHIK